MHSHDSLTLRSQWRLLLLLAFVAVAVPLLAWVHGEFIRKESLPASLIIDAYAAQVQPESTEQFVFVLLAALVPLLSWSMVLGGAPVGAPHHLAQPSLKQRLTRAGGPVALAILLFIPFLGSDFTATLLGKYGTPDQKALLYPLLMLPASAAVVAMHLRIGTKVGAVPIIRLPVVVWGTFAAGLALQILSWRLVSFSSVTGSNIWSTHADPVFFALSQTVGGRTLLVDLPSQYGLFPELLAPLFQVVGLSVFKLTLLFALMQAMSLVALLFVLSRLVKSRLILLSAGLCLLMVTFETVLYFVGTEERYFQYWPIRFFWPALSVLALYRFAVHRSMGRLFALSVISAVGLLWNADSGLFVVIALGHTCWRG
jgi:hypothetical protein